MQRSLGDKKADLNNLCGFIASVPLPQVFTTLAQLKNTRIMLQLAYNANEFGAFLHQPQAFVLDLSKASVIECINELIKVRLVSNPKAEKQYFSLRKHFSKLEDSFGITIMPNQITDIFWSHFVAFLINESHLALSSVRTICAQLRSVLAWSSRYNCNVAPSFDQIKIPKYRKQQISLTPDEVSHIYHFDISKINRRPQYLRTLEKVRDTFVLGCSLGQRYSDLKRINGDCFERNIFSIIQQKTGNRARVDIDKMAADKYTAYKLLEKYDYKCPLPIDTTDFDRYLKELLRYIGCEFLEEIKYERKVNSIVETISTPKWKMISSHTCRRTFATINVLRGYSEAEIRRGTGHSSGTSFERYICYNED